MTSYVSPPGGYYFFADDSTPLVHVWSTDAGAFVVVGDATYLSWVVNSSPNRRLISGTSTGTAGVVRLQVSDTQGYVTGQIKTVTGVGGTTEANVTTTVSLVDATNIELQGTTWANAWTSGGTIGGAPEYQTLAAIVSYIDNFNKSIYTLQQNTVTSLTITAAFSLSNPLTLATDLTNNTSDNIKITLPQANVPGSIPVGQSVTFINQGTKYFAFKQYDTVGVGPSVWPSSAVTFILKSNATSGGTWTWYHTPYLESGTVTNALVYFDGEAYQGTNVAASGIVATDTGSKPTVMAVDYPLAVTGTNRVQSNFTNTSSILNADVTVSATNTYFVGPSMAQGTTGTWYASGGVTLTSSTADLCYAKLWDGTAVIASCAFTIVAGQAASAELSGIISSPTSNIRVSVANLTSTNSKIKFNQTGSSADGYIYGVRLA